MSPQCPGLCCFDINAHKDKECVIVMCALPFLGPAAPAEVAVVAFLQQDLDALLST